MPVKLEASVNVSSIMVTDDTSHVDKSEFIELAPEKVNVRSVTFDVSQFAKFAFIALASLKANFREVTEDVVHFSNPSPVKVAGALANALSKSVTPLTSQSPMGPHLDFAMAVVRVTQSFAAFLNVASVSGD